MVGSKQLIVGGIVLGVAVGIGAVVFGMRGESVSNTEKPEKESKNVPVIANLALPFQVKDINLQQGEVNPLGVVRFSADRPELGHSGIDIPLFERAPITAVADGEIITIKSAGDDWGGQGVYQLLQSTGTGQGMAFIYEHITPAKGISAGSNVKQGDVVGYKTAPEGFTAHFQLSEVFNNYEYTRNNECWVDFLSSVEKSTLDAWWGTYSASETLTGAWRSNVEEGAYPFRGLLDTAVYPNGPQLCYPQGTDVR